jgi:uncharacterized protein YndB with AHSA1/START domain
LCNCTDKHYQLYYKEKFNRATELRHDEPIRSRTRHYRVFNAPRELVFKAWTEPKHIEQWFGPKGFTTRVDKLDFRPLGHWRYVMIAPDGTEYPSEGVFREIVPPERIVTSDEFGEGIEQVVEADLPQGMVVTVLFEDLGDQTKLTIQIMHESASDRRKHEEMGVVAGWNSTLDGLDEHLAKSQPN